MKKRKFWLAILVVIVAGVSGFYVSSTTISNVSFDSETWKHVDPTILYSKVNNPRRKMLKDLTERVLPGSTCKELIQLLNSELYERQSCTGAMPLSFSLGKKKRKSVISEKYDFLIIILDEEGNYERFYIFPEYTG